MIIHPINNRNSKLKFGEKRIRVVTSQESHLELAAGIKIDFWFLILSTIAYCFTSDFL